MKLGTKIKMHDGRIATVVYNSLIGVGVKWGAHNPDPQDFIGTTGNTIDENMPAEWQWEPDALLRDPWDGCERSGFTMAQCIGENYEIVA